MLLLFHLYSLQTTLLFFKANHTSCSAVRDVIDNICQISGETVNFDKSSVTFSPNCVEDHQQELASILRTPCASSIERYLGCNIDINGRNTSTLPFLLDKVQRKILSWKNLSLSPAGRLLLANAILAALCSYTLGAFLMPKRLSKKIDSSLAQFWWNGCGWNRGIHWVRQEDICLPKSDGGVGLYKAALTKQAMRIHSNKDLLISKIYRAKYKCLPVEAGLQGNIPKQASWGFRGLCRRVSACKEGFGRAVVNGSSILVWQDNWVNGVKPMPKNESYLDPNLKVTELIDIVFQ